MSRTIQRLLAATGILAVLGEVANIILSPDAGTPGDSIRRITAVNIHNSAAILGWTYVGAVLDVLISVFLCLLVTDVMRSRPVDSLARVLGVTGAIGFLMLGLLNKILEATLAYDAPRGLAPGLVAVVFDALTNTEFLLMFPLALVVSAVSVTAFREGRLPRAVCWAGFLLAAVQVVASAGLISPASGVSGMGVLALMGTLLWLAATSVTLIRRVNIDVPVRRESTVREGFAESVR